MADAHIRAVITADDRASATLRGFDSRLSSLGATVKRVFAAAAVLEGVRRLTGFIWDSVQAFAEEEVVVNRLQTGIKNVTSARNDNIDSLLKQASALQIVTRFSDDQIISAQGILTTFQLNQQAIEKITPRLIDMSEGIARVSGGLPDLEGNAMLVAKAIGGEDVQGMVGALRRVGVIMTAHQEKVLKTGDMQERLSIITKILDQNFKGLGESAGKTTAGRIAQLQNALSDLQEEFGAVIAEAITPFIKQLTRWAKTDEAKVAVRRIAEGIVAVAKAIGSFLKTEWPTIKSALKTMGTIAETTAGAIRSISNAIGSIPTPPKWVTDGIKGGAGAALRRIINLPGFASGVENFSGGPAIVGERGPEIVHLPGGSSVTPNHKIGGMSMNITIQAGAFMGNRTDARRYAREIINQIQDLANMKGVSVNTLIEANNGVSA